MVSTDRAVLHFFFLIMCSINGLHFYPRNHPSLGILNELIGTDSKSPLIVVVDSNNKARTLNDEPDQGNGYRQGHGQRHSKSCPNHPDHVHSPRHNHDSGSPKLSNQDYEAALYELLRTSQKMMENQERQGSSNDRQKIGGKKDSFDKNRGKTDKQEFLAEQCSQSENSCGGNCDD